MTFKRHILALMVAGNLAAVSNGICIAAEYSPGASDTEIKIGNTMPYSGPASGYSAIGKSLSAYFAIINDQGGINGRKINFISRDDAYSPPKTVEVVRKLVEEDQVLMVFQSLGTPPNLAIRGYLNDNKIPQLFVGSGADQWNDPKHYPWTMGWQPSYGTEARIFARYVLENLPDAKIAVLYQNDDFGKDYVNGMRSGLGDKAGKMIVATQSYETTDPTVELAGLGVAGKRRRCVADRSHSQIHHARDPQGLRYRLAPDAVCQFGLYIRRIGNETRRSGKECRRHVGDLHQRSQRSTLAGHARIQGLAGVDEKI